MHTQPIGSSCYDDLIFKTHVYNTHTHTRTYITYAPQARPPSQPTMRTFCLHCLAFGEMKRCTRCRFAHFCDRACMKQNWPIHKRVCGKPWPDCGFDTACLQATTRTCTVCQVRFCEHHFSLHTDTEYVSLRTFSTLEDAVTFVRQELVEIGERAGACDPSLFVEKRLTRLFILAFERRALRRCVHASGVVFGEEKDTPGAEWIEGYIDAPCHKWSCRHYWVRLPNNTDYDPAKYITALRLGWIMLDEAYMLSRTPSFPLVDDLETTESMHALYEELRARPQHEIATAILEKEI